MLQVGDGGGLSNGGSLYLAAGQTSSQGRKGGTVTIGTLCIHQKYSIDAYPLLICFYNRTCTVGGEGSSAQQTDGGDGGNVVVFGGEAKGESRHDNGGSIIVRGGTSFTGYGGSLQLKSGYSTESSSGDILVTSSPAGHRDGSSGSLTLSTGHSMGGAGSSGPIVINTGDSHGGPVGSIKVEVGDTPIEFKTGFNPNTSSGAFRVVTADAGRSGNSGDVSLRTGKAREGDSGSVLFETGCQASAKAVSGIYCSIIKCTAIILLVHALFMKVQLNSRLAPAEMHILVAMSK